MIDEVIDYDTILVNQLTADKQESKESTYTAWFPDFTSWCPLPKISIQAIILFFVLPCKCLWCGATFWYLSALLLSSTFSAGTRDLRWSASVKTCAALGWMSLQLCEYKRQWLSRRNTPDNVEPDDLCRQSRVRHDKTPTSKPEALAKDVGMVSCAAKFKCRTLSHTPLTQLRWFQTFRLIFSGTITATRLVGGTANWNHITAQIKTSQAGFAAENAPSRTAPLFLLKWTSSKKALAPDRYPIMCAASLSPLHLPL